jgi:murein hydrolase activator
MSVAAERLTGEGRRCALGWLALVSTLAAAALARAEDKPGNPPEADDLSIKRLQLRGVEDVMGESAAHKRRLEEEMSAHAAVRENLTKTLLDATRRLQETEARAAETETRLGVLAADEKKITQSLEDRRALIVEVLIVLQRMGRRPPPALLARPQDILEALRAALALGGLLPQMRAEVQTLQRDLAELVRLRETTREEQARLTQETTALADQRKLLNELITSRQQAMAAAQTALQAESEQIDKLARQATSLKELISRMEAESAAARNAAAAARKADEDRAAAQAKLDSAAREKALAAPFRDPARLAPAVSFADLKGKLSFPVAGEVLRRYGAPDGFGGKEKAWFIGARENGVVVAPCDGWIAFSGPYRTFGQLLIINAGDGYYVVLAGMSRSNVNVGQFVLAGEPVASMGDGAAQTAAAIAINAKKPILYVEFRKDGTSIDSSPWWAKSDSRKVGG